MAELEVINLSNGKASKKINVQDEIFKAPFRPDLFHSYVVMQSRTQRQGTHDTKTRAEVSGTGKKPFRQKGTGNARQGTLIGPHQVGGGVAFGPKPRSYKTSLNKKAKRKTLCSALSQKRFEGKLSVFSEFEVASGKTKDAQKQLSSLKAKKILLIAELSEMTLRSLSNLKNVKVLNPFALNVRDLLNHDLVLISEKALAQVVENLTAEKKEKAA